MNAFGRFYSLRSVCLTTIFTAFFRSEVLAQTHRSVNVPIKHYIDFQSRNLIDNAFSLPNLPDSDIDIAEDTILDFEA